jgi:dihydrofolate synthase / folylpolyglutamate synthase
MPAKVKSKVEAKRGNPRSPALTKRRTGKTTSTKTPPIKNTSSKTAQSKIAGSSSTEKSRKGVSTAGATANGSRPSARAATSALVRAATARPSIISEQRPGSKMALQPEIRHDPRRISIRQDNGPRPIALKPPAARAVPPSKSASALAAKSAAPSKPVPAKPAAQTPTLKPIPTNKPNPARPPQGNPVVAATSSITAPGIRTDISLSPANPPPAGVPIGSNNVASLTRSEVSPNSSYGKALKFLATLSDYEHRRIVRYTPENFNLDRMRQLLKRLGDPHGKFRTVHVAGTKGKGSTCTMIAAMVQANGYKTGLYTSPHLNDIRERIQINGEMISREDFARIARQIEPLVARIKPTPTYFDVLTAICFQYFAEQKVELGVIETGLGGRLDSTNVITPEVTAVTSISFDHMAQLGTTLEKIAGEKAGIFKPGIPAVTCVQSSEGIEAVLKEQADKIGCTFDVCGKSIEFSYRFESSRLAGPHFRLSLTTPHSKFEHLAVPMVGEHQAVNCGVALTVIDKLKARGIALSDARCVEGLAKAYIPGRLELVSTTPRIIVDGAHNAASIDSLIKSIGQHIPYDSMVLIFACCSDKDVRGMLEKIASGADKVIFTRLNNIRTAQPEDLAARYNEMFGKMCQVAPTLEAALVIAKRAVSKEDLICITGSFYLVAEAKRLYPKQIMTPISTAASQMNLAAAAAGA